MITGKLIVRARSTIFEKVPFSDIFLLAFLPSHAHCSTVTILSLIISIVFIFQFLNQRNIIVFEAVTNIREGSAKGMKYCIFITTRDSSKDHIVRCEVRIHTFLPRWIQVLIKVLPQWAPLLTKNN